MFTVEINNGSIERILDKRYDFPVDITDGTGRFGYLAYTLKNEDINAQEHPGCVPFEEKYAGYDKKLRNAEFGTELLIEKSNDGICLDISCDGENVDGAGLFLPFNFVGRKNGYWKEQFTISSPYHSKDYRYHMFYLARPDGKGIACIVENEIDCFMINYSPYQGGHWIRGITFWSQLDKAYGRPKRKEKRIRLHILPVSSYMETMERACRIWGCTALYYDNATGFINQPFSLRTMGQEDEIRVVSPSGTEQPVSDGSFVPREYGFYTATPYSQGKPGMDCTVFAMDSVKKMQERAAKIIRQDTGNVIGHTADGLPVYEPAHLSYRGCKDFNLCEHSMWVWGALKYLRRNSTHKRLNEDVLNLLRIVDPSNHVNLYRCSYDPADHYNTIGDYRIQEAFQGVNILLDAYHLYQEPRYLELAKTALREKLLVDQLSDGGIYRWAGEGAARHREDYTTVTFMALPVVDMALILRQKNDPDWAFFAKAAIAMADHMVARGLSFPTEGGTDPEVNGEEVEDGSISCTALTLLYVYDKIVKKQEYLDLATEILKIHDAYSVYTHHPCMYRSSLRWWETIWEGDSDGPAICFGHAWTIWRAEAEYWYGMVMHDDARLLDSYNGFMTNLSKTDIDGNMYAIYQYEQIASPCLEWRGWLTDRSNREGFPKRTDVTLSRYAWARADDTWFQTVAILPDQLLMAKYENGMIVPEYSDFTKLYMGNVTGEYFIRAEHSFEVISKKQVSVEGTGIVKITITD
ncbi:MAG: hypothetical protein IKW10_03065 [Oscillospiraceae bacterium]|nr:hypothetical protein [Oscillospiraceae bacterium]